MLVVNESAIQMSNSTEGMTELLAFVPVDEVNGGYVNESYLICAESEIRNYPQCRYCYRTAGTQLIICSVRPDGTAGQPVPMYGNIAFAWLSLDSENGEKHYPFVVIEDEKDSFENVSPADVMKNIAQNTIENIKGALYEDGMGREADLGIDGPMMLHYSGEKTKPTDNDEKNVASAADQSARNAAKAEAAKFDEGNSKDRVFVNNQNNQKAGAQNDLKALSKVATFDNNLISKNVNSAAVLQKTEDVVKQADTEWHDSDKHALRLDHKDAGADSANQFNLANMEYGEINLGTGTDKVDIYKTIYREDGFQTFTVVNAGSGKNETAKGDRKENAPYDDEVTVHSYAAEERSVIATISGLEKTADTDEIKYNVAGFVYRAGFGAEWLTTVNAENTYAASMSLNVPHRVFLNVEYTDGTVQRREVVLEKLSSTSVTLKRDFTPVAAGVEIKFVSLVTDLTGDGMLVVNAQGGDDKINATNADEITREDLVLIGGTGADTIDVATNAIAFGDRGQVVYKNEKGEAVTVLGSQDIDVGEKDAAKLNEADYTTPASKFSKNADGQDVANTNYFQTDGVVRDAFTTRSMSDTVGGNDIITTHGDKNVAIGGAGADTIHLDGKNNVAVGDNGEVKYVASDSVVGADGNVVGHVYGDSTKTYLNYVQSTSDEFGDKDTMTTGDGKNVVIGGTDADTITIGSGNDVVIGDGGEVYVDRERNPLFVNNAERNLPVTEKDDDGNDVVKNSSGGDTIVAGDGDNVVFGGLNGNDAEDSISTGKGKDVVFGDNGYATFRGNADVAQHLKMDNLPTIYTESTLSFNFQGPAQYGIDADEQAGAVADYTVNEVDEQSGETVASAKHADYRVGNWNNIKGPSGIEAGTYGNEDDEIVLFDNGTRASAVSVTYGATEAHRVDTTTGQQIRLHGYDQGNMVYGPNPGDVNLMKSGLDTSRNNDQTKLLVQVDGLAQYFTDYDVVVYLDMVRENSWSPDSVRVVTLYRDYVDANGETHSDVAGCYYVNDPEANTFNGNWVVATAKTVEDAKKRDDDGNLVEQANCVIFKGITGDRFHVEITDGDPSNGQNGKDRAGIAGIQVRGRHHKQDVAASTDIDHGGNDIIRTSGGDDIVVGGTGSDRINTYGDEHYGIDDNDVVFGDNASMLFTDRDSNPDTATTVTSAESVVSTNMAANYDDTILTGDGNDTVVGGLGADRIDAGATSAADGTIEGVDVVSLNFVDISTPESLLLQQGESAGGVVDSNWHNVYQTGWQQNEFGDDPTDVHFRYHINGNNDAPAEKVNAAMDADTGNNKMLKSYVCGQVHDTLTLELFNLPASESDPRDVYVYISGIDNERDGYDYIFEIAGSNGETFYLNDWIGDKFDGEYKQVTCTSYQKGSLASGVTPNITMIGNYVVFRGVSQSSLTVSIRRYDSTMGDANWNNIPVFSGVQIVKSTLPADLIKVGGDHDKDLVFGDEARLHFDLDIPFAGDEKIGNYRNRVITAESVAMTADNVAKGAVDTIVTGKDRDVVVGGEGIDNVYSGAGDDVVVGDRASLMVEHNNPVGVFSQNVEIVLEDNDYSKAQRRRFLDGDNGMGIGEMQDQVKQGRIEGIALETLDNTGDHVFDDSAKNLVLNSEPTVGGFEVPTIGFDDSVTEPDDNNNGSENGNENNNENNGSENGNENNNENNGGLGEQSGVTTVESFLMETPLHLTAGETVKVVFHEYFRDSNYVPNLKLIFNGSEGQFAAIEVDLDTASGPLHYDIPSTWWYAVDVPDQPNGENGCFVVYFKAEEDTVITVSVAR